MQLRCLELNMHYLDLNLHELCRQRTSIFVVTSFGTLRVIYDPSLRPTKQSHHAAGWIGVLSDCLPVSLGLAPKAWLSHTKQFDRPRS